MGSGGVREREREPLTRHQTGGSSLSSLIVRPSESEGGGGSDYEPGEFRREKITTTDNNDRGKNRTLSPSYSRSLRFTDRFQGSVSPLHQRRVDRRFSSDFDYPDGNGIHPGSVSPLHQMKADEHYGSDFDNSGGNVLHMRSVSPARGRKADHRYGADFDRPDRNRMHTSSLSPLRRRGVDHHSDFDNSWGDAMHISSVSPLLRRKVNRRYTSDFDPPGGNGMLAGSASPLNQRKVDDRYGSNFDHPGGPRPRFGFRGGRGRGRYREFSPPGGRGRGDRSFGRGFDEPKLEFTSFEEESVSRNNPNVPPREGDWICSEPSCGNLNFARRAYCNNCNKLRFGRRGGPPGSPRGNHLRLASPPWRDLPRSMSPQRDHGPGRVMNGFGTPRGWDRDGPREFRAGPPPRRHGARFLDHDVRRERPDYHEEDEYGDMSDGPSSPQWGRRGQGRGGFFHDRRGYDRNSHRPRLLPPPQGPWVHERRERSRSPMRGGLRDYHREFYIGRGRDYRRGMGARGMARGRMDGGY